MLIDELVNKCYERDMSRDSGILCDFCSYGAFCHHDCQKCLEAVHFPREDRPHREYDCPHMADCYFCKYVYKYASEVVYGLSSFTGLRGKPKLKVMSVGCGPCTDLVGIDFLLQEGWLQCSEIQYLGIDPLSSVWGPVWRDISDYMGSRVRIYPVDIFSFMDDFIRQSWVPDLIIFQYVFSDMVKNSERSQILQFIDDMAFFINSHVEEPIHILCNDINLDIERMGGRELFDRLESRIEGKKRAARMHFDNSTRPRHYDYGQQYQDNRLVFESIPDEIIGRYNPFLSCASAQMLIERQI